jgi:hypothetical protein
MQTTPKDKGAVASKQHTPTNHGSYSNSSAAQRQRLLEWLRLHGSISTIDARDNLDIMMPAARVHELRHRFGYQIDMVWIKQPTDCGKLHRVALYVLKSEEVRHGS